METKDFLHELKTLGIENKQTRRDIVNMFSGISLGDETQEEKRKNQLKVFQILMKESSAIRKFLMEHIGLSDGTISLLNQHLLGKEFYDLKLIFESLRDFFSSHYTTLDFVVYRMNETKNTLEFYAGKDYLATNISLSENSLADTNYEISAFCGEKSTFFSILEEKSGQEDFSFGSVASIKIVTQTDTFIFSFYKKEIESVDEDDLKSEVLKIKKLFTKYGLISILDTIIKYVNTKYKDELTGILNRNYISALPKRFKYSVLFIDLDKFKSINDLYGHQNGDKVLIGLASVLKDSVRPRDRVCRISGDEFAVLVPTNSPSELEAIEKRIIRFLQQKKFSFLNVHTKQVDEVFLSATIGKALNNGQKTLEQLIAEADLAMLGGKDGEGNNYRLYSAIKSLPIEQQKELLSMGICDVRCGLQCEKK